MPKRELQWGSHLEILSAQLMVLNWVSSKEKGWLVGGNEGPILSLGKSDRWVLGPVLGKAEGNKLGE
jgi:hypothetical protein